MRFMVITRRQSLLLALAINCCLFGVVNAQSKVSESRLIPYLGTPNLVGQAKFTYWGIDVYQASLWSSESGLTPEQWETKPLALDLLYLRDFKGADIAKRSIDEIQAQSPLPKTKAQAWLKSLEVIFPNVSKGQTLTGVYLPNAGMHFLFNGTYLGEIKDPELSKSFFDIWLSKQTSAPELRKKLFAKNL